MKKVVLIDYGVGNIRSVQRSLEHVGATVILSSDPDVISSASRLVLPGVGAFKNGMEKLTEQNLAPAIHSFVQSGNPLLGICLGMQMLFEESEEYGNNKGLGLMKGNVIAIPQSDDGAFKRKIPHIGWNALNMPKYRSNWFNTCLQSNSPRDFYYFVHSFMVKPDDKYNILAECDYEDLSIVVAVMHENITGLQFHPEKSSRAGLRILEHFIEYK